MPSKTIEDFAYQVRDYMRSAEVVEGKNLFPPTVYPLGIPTTSTGTSAFNDTPTATMFISKVDNNTDYVISRSTGDRFRIALSVDMPAVDVVCNVIFNDPSLDDAQFNSGNYNYVAFFANNASRETADVIEPMLCTLAEWEKSHTYEPYYVPVKDRPTYVKIAEADANQTWAAQLGIMNTAFATLTMEEQNNAYLSMGEDFNDGKLAPVVRATRCFFQVAMFNTGESLIRFIRLVSSKITEVRYPIGGTPSVTDISNNNNTVKLCLYVEK